MIDQFFGRINRTEQEPYAEIEGGNPYSGNFTVSRKSGNEDDHVFRIRYLEWWDKHPIVGITPRQKDARYEFFNNSSGEGTKEEPYKLSASVTYEGENFHFMASTGTDYRVHTTKSQHVVQLIPRIITIENADDSSQQFATLELSVESSTDLFAGQLKLDKGSRLQITRPTKDLDEIDDFKVKLALSARTVDFDGTTYQLRGFTYNAHEAGPVGWQDNGSNGNPFYELTTTDAHNGGAPATTMQSFVITAVPLDQDGSVNRNLPVLISDPRIRLATVDPGGPVLTT